MPDFQGIWPKLERLWEDRERLESYRQLTREEFLSDPTIQGATCYLFLTAIQGCIDIGAQLIATLGLRKPVDSADVFTVLREEGILSQDLTQRLMAMVRFRNILVHKYRLVDLDKVYDNLQDDLGDFDQFAGQVVTFIEQQEKGQL